MPARGRHMPSAFALSGPGRREITRIRRRNFPQPLRRLERQRGSDASDGRAISGSGVRLARIRSRRRFMPREMTEDERLRFEKDTLHHTAETTPAAGPASEAEIVRDVERPKDGGDAEILPSNPD